MSYLSKYGSLYETSAIRLPELFTVAFDAVRCCCKILRVFIVLTTTLKSEVKPLSVVQRVLLYCLDCIVNRKLTNLRKGTTGLRF